MAKRMAPKGKTIRSVRAIEPGDAVNLVFADGTAAAVVEAVTPNAATTGEATTGGEA